MNQLTTACLRWRMLLTIDVMLTFLSQLSTLSNCAILKLVRLAPRWAVRGTPLLVLAGSWKMSSNNRNSRDRCQIVISQQYWLFLSQMTNNLKYWTAASLLNMSWPPMFPVWSPFFIDMSAEPPGVSAAARPRLAPHRGSLNSKCSVPAGSLARTPECHECHVSWPADKQITGGLPGKIPSNNVGISEILLRCYLHISFCGQHWIWFQWRRKIHSSI